MEGTLLKEFFETLQSLVEGFMLMLGKIVYGFLKVDSFIRQEIPT